MRTDYFQEYYVCARRKKVIFFSFKLKNKHLHANEPETSRNIVIATNYSRWEYLPEEMEGTTTIRSKNGKAKAVNGQKRGRFQNVVDSIM